ncbi:MAG: V-type ATP synthase subunit D [Chloroflexi bacterium]|nr:V-type ATP synthase subunit D [Chloroflexota bacterium]
MRNVSSTRMALLARKEQIKLAEQGRELLEQKRTALMEELLRVAGVVIEETETLQQLANVAVQALARAYATAGEETVKSAALASRDVLPLRISSANVMGVRVTQIEQTRSARLPHDRGYSIIGTSTTLDEAAGAFEAEVDMIIQLAESELRLRRLIGEIQRTSRRVNALKNILIPQLESEIQYIQMTLDERERADHFRLKLTKRVLEHRRAHAEPPQVPVRSVGGDSGRSPGSS